MSKPFKFKDIQSAVFWNDTHKLTLIIEPLEPVDPPEPEPIAIPTGIQLRVLEAVIDIKIPTDINVKQIP